MQLPVLLLRCKRVLLLLPMLLVAAVSITSRRGHSSPVALLWTHRTTSVIVLLTRTVAGQRRALLLIVLQHGGRIITSSIISGLRRYLPVAVATLAGYNQASNHSSKILQDRKERGSTAGRYVSARGRPAQGVNFAGPGHRNSARSQGGRVSRLRPAYFGVEAAGRCGAFTFTFLLHLQSIDGCCSCCCT